LQDVKSREQASLFTNGFLGIERNLLPELPKDEFYICDLLGLEVYNQEDQRLLGIIYDVIENKAHPILHLKNSKEKDIFIPFITKFVISLENNKLWVDWYSDESEIMNKQ
jgi:16S rRNA processing protein RimM